MEILNKYGKYTAVNLLVNWNIVANSIMCLRLLTSTLRRVNGDQSSVLTLKAVVHYMNNWFSKCEANMAK